MLFGKDKSRSRRQPRATTEQQQTFRRSQTLMGSSSPQVRAAGEKTATLQSERLKRQSLQRRQRVITLLLISAVAVIGVIYYVISQYISSVDTVRFSDTATVHSSDSARYRQALTDYIYRHPGERFYFALNADRVTEYVAQKYPEVSHVSVDNGTFYVGLRRPIAVWSVGRAQYFVDKDGYSFQKNYYAAPTVSVQDQTGIATDEGRALAGRSFLRFLGRMVSLLEESGLGGVSEATLPPNTTREVDFKLQGRAYTIKTHIDRDPAQEVEDLKRVVGYLEQKSIAPQYIDIRVSGRAYYK